MRRLLIGLLALGMLTGCASQLDGLAPVSGDDIAQVRIATIDAVLGQKLTIRDAPVCTKVDDGISCVGSLTDGATIQSTVLGTSPDDMTVVVNGTVIYDGPIASVLDEAARSAP
jgi:hypothetical protein